MVKIILLDFEDLNGMAIINSWNDPYNIANPVF